jgi:hypothetical protein
MYILNAWNVEGVEYDKPKLKMSGIEAVRSSTPHVCRENIKKAFSIVVNGNQAELIKFIEDFMKLQENSFLSKFRHSKRLKDSALRYQKRSLNQLIKGVNRIATGEGP